MKKDDGSSILPSIAVDVAGYIAKMMAYLYCWFLLHEKNDEWMTSDRRYEVAEVAVLRFRFGRLGFPGSIGFLDFRKQASMMKMIPVLDDGNAVVDEEHQRTWWYVGCYDYPYPLRCGIVLLNFGILP